MAKITLNTLFHAIQKLDTNLNAKIDTRFDFLKEQIQNVDAKVDRLDVRVDRLEVKVDKLDAKVGQLDAKVGQLDAKVDNMAKNLKIIRDQTAHITERVSTLEHAAKLNPI